MSKLDGLDEGGLATVGEAQHGQGGEVGLFQNYPVVPALYCSALFFFLFGRLTTKDTMVVINKFSSHCGDFSSNVLDHWFHEILREKMREKYVKRLKQ